MDYFHVLPAAGSATRMGGLPKYLLPVGDSAKPLLYFHLKMAFNSSTPTILMVHPKMFDYVSELCASWKFPSIQIKAILSDTMTETCQGAINDLRDDNYVSVSMPDTFFSQMLMDAYNPLESLHKTNPTLAIWNIQKFQIGKLGQVQVNPVSGKVLEMVDKNESCAYKYSWGMMSVKVSLLRSFSVSDSHPGISLSKMLKDGLQIDSILQKDIYWDCGTPQEYAAALQLSLNVTSQ